MTDLALSVERLSKVYRIGRAQPSSYRSLRDMGADVLQACRRWVGPRPEPGHDPDLHWAVRDVSFAVRRGEVLGLVGRNGAGKSTLLKVLSRITEPTSGHARLNGRVGSLLEVGTGFHPELSGRENILLSGAILGMSRADIRARFDEIVAFSGVEKFIDTPVKRYSSGMYVRLAFAVAAHLEPEILLVDEVLAVGDAAFQRKCFGRMGDVAKEGRTVLFVSHNLMAVEGLCSRVVWLRDGRVAGDGPSASIISAYLASTLTPTREQTWDDLESAPGNDQVKLRRVCVRPETGSPADEIDMRTPVVLEFDYWNLDPGSVLNLSLHVYNEQGTMVFNTTSLREPTWDGRPFPAGLFRSTCAIPGDLLNAGLHRVELLMVKDRGSVVYRQDDLLVFDVRDAIALRAEWFGRWPGAVHPNLSWSTRLIAASPGAAAPARVGVA